MENCSLEFQRIFFNLGIYLHIFKEVKKIKYLDSFRIAVGVISIHNHQNSFWNNNQSSWSSLKLREGDVVGSDGSSTQNLISGTHSFIISRKKFYVLSWTRLSIIFFPLDIFMNFFVQSFAVPCSTRYAKKSWQNLNTISQLQVQNQNP